MFDNNKRLEKKMFSRLNPMGLTDLTVERKVKKSRVLLQFLQNSIVNDAARNY